MAKKKKDSEEKKKPVKKKRKVGRPKKRGRKKKYYKPKKKRKKKSQSQRRGYGTNSTYNRVRRLLWATYKENYPSYRDFISNETDADGKKIKGTNISSRVYAECKDLDCTDEDIIQIYIGITGGGIGDGGDFDGEQGEPPLIPDELFNPQPYWTLVTENFYDGLDERLFLVSPMLLNLPPFFRAIMGEDRCVNENNEIVDINLCEEEGNRLVRGKKWRFQPFVNWCNYLMSLLDDVESPQVPHWKFIGNEENPFSPYWSEVNQRWEIEVVPCINDAEATIYNWDFDPSNLEPELPEEFELPETPPPTEEPEEPEEPTRRIEDVQIEQIEKTGKLDRLEKKKEGILKEIETYMKLGDRGDALIDRALERLDKINEQIDEID